MRGRLNHNPGFTAGDPWGVCDICGLVYRQSELKNDYRGLRVDEACWEPRHIQEFHRGKPDTITVGEIARPHGTDQFIDVTYPAPSAAHDIPSATHGNDID